MSYIGKLPTAAPLTSSDVADGIITNAKLAQDIISGDTALGAEPADTDEFLVSDAGVLKRMDYSYIKGGISEADQWRLNTTLSITSEATITNWERPDDQESSIDCFEKIGTGMSHSSGTFTFPSTGVWLVRFFAKVQTGAEAAVYTRIYFSKDGTNYDKIATGDLYISNGFNNTVGCEYLCDVVSTSNDLMQFKAQTSSGTGSVQGHTDYNVTSVTFIRLGDT